MKAQAVLSIATCALLALLPPGAALAQDAAVAKQAYKEGRAILDVAKETTGLSEKVLKKLLDPAVLAKGRGMGAGWWNRMSDFRPVCV